MRFASPSSIPLVWQPSSGSPITSPFIKDLPPGHQTLLQSPSWVEIPFAECSPLSMPILSATRLDIHHKGASQSEMQAQFLEVDSIPRSGFKSQKWICIWEADLHLRGRFADQIHNQFQEADVISRSDVDLVSTFAFPISGNELFLLPTHLPSNLVHNIAFRSYRWVSFVIKGWEHSRWVEVWGNLFISYRSQQLASDQSHWGSYRWKMETND